MKLTVHPSARENLKERALALVSHLEPMPEKYLSKPNKGPMNPNVHVVATLDAKSIIGGISSQWTDEDGNIAARAFNANKQLIGLHGDSHKLLRLLAEDFLKSLRPSNVVGAAFIEKTIFEWVERRFRHESIAGFADFVIDKTEESIVKAEFWLPITFFNITNRLEVGNVSFRMITKAFLDDYEVHLKSELSTGNDSPDFQQHIENLRRKIQNTGVGVIEFEAEPEHGYEKALMEVERSLSMMRFFSPFCISPTQVCYSAPMDKKEPEGEYYMIVREGKVIQETDRFSGARLRHWVITAEDFRDCLNAGLSILNDLLKKEKLTDFEEYLLNVLMLYSKSALANSLSDRLTYLLIALETLFLKDSSEPIQDNLSLRIAYMQPVSVLERKEIVANVKEIYKLRSGFIHHGKDVSIDELAKLKTFWWNSWLALSSAILYAKEERTRKQFFEELDNRKLGA